MVTSFVGIDRARSVSLIGLVLGIARAGSDWLDGLGRLAMAGVARPGGRFVVGIALFHEGLHVANSEQTTTAVKAMFKASGPVSR
jgi:hypothetical protein